MRQTGDPIEQLRDIDETFTARRPASLGGLLGRKRPRSWHRKNFAATGSFIAEDRGRALDLLGFASQLIFNTFHNCRLCAWEHSGDLELAVGAARAHNRAMIEFCSDDPRLLPTLYVPLADLERAGELAERRSPWARPRCSLPPGCPPTHSPSHIALDSVWARPARPASPSCSTSAARAN